MSWTPIRHGGHFSWEELASPDGACYPEDFRDSPTRLGPLLDAAEAVRAEIALEVGFAVPCVGAHFYRSPARQEQFRALDAARAKAGLAPIYKAAKKSQHVEGRAVDYPQPRELSWDEFVCCVKRACSRPGIKVRYIEWRPNYRYAHLDVRTTEHCVEETVA